MKRTHKVLAVVAAGLLTIGSSALAQNLDVIKERQQVMKMNAQAAKQANSIIKGETPYDAAKADELFRMLNDDARKFATLFPEDSKTGGKTEAAPAIWEKPAEFKAANDKFIADTQAAVDAKPQDVASFEASFKTVAANCQSCHQQFRQRD
ncbi:cytochrome c [Aureimonas sp. AU4]|uniref:c-type cytochrome n=1 Tax=Aureimonas sp. AU4 TaxID=1638163 RepID=UPI000781D879|nr:cytochrome c [Aureimonas sp. AU4]